MGGRSERTLSHMWRGWSTAGLLPALRHHGGRSSAFYFLDCAVRGEVDGRAIARTAGSDVDVGLAGAAR